MASPQLSHDHTTSNFELSTNPTSDDTMGHSGQASVQCKNDGTANSKSGLGTSSLSGPCLEDSDDKRFATAIGNVIWPTLPGLTASGTSTAAPAAEPPSAAISSESTMEDAQQVVADALNAVARPISSDAWSATVPPKGRARGAGGGKRRTAQPNLDLADCKSGVQQQQLRSACDACHRMKRKCDGKQPCTRCNRHNRDCAYSCKQKSGPPKGSKRKLVEAEDDLPENRNILDSIRHDQSNNDDRCSSSSNNSTKKSTNSKIRSARPQRHPLNTWPQAKDEGMETWSGNDDDDDNDEETTVDSAADNEPPRPAIFSGTHSPIIMRPDKQVPAAADPVPSPEAMAAAAAAVAASRINAAFPKPMPAALAAAGIGSQFMVSGTAASLLPGIIGSGGGSGVMPIVSGGLVPNHGHSHPQYGTMYQPYPPEVYALYLSELRQRGGVGMVHNNNPHDGGNHVSNGVGKAGQVVGDSLISEPIRMAHASGITQYGNSLESADTIASRSASVPAAGFAATGAGTPANIGSGSSSSSCAGGHTGSLPPPTGSETLFTEEVDWVEKLRKADTPAAAQGLSVSSSSSSPSPSLLPPHASAENITHTDNDTDSGILRGVTKSMDGGGSAAAVVAAASALATAVAVAIAEDRSSCISPEKVVELPTPPAPTVSSVSSVSSAPSASSVPSVPSSSSAPSIPSVPSSRACFDGCQLGADAKAGPNNGAAASNNDTNNTNNNHINYTAPVAGGISPVKGHGSGNIVTEAAPTATVSETTKTSGKHYTSVSGDVKGMKPEGEHEACACSCTTDKEREAALGMVLHSNRSTMTVTADEPELLHRPGPTTTSEVAKPTISAL